MNLTPEELKELTEIILRKAKQDYPDIPPEEWKMVEVKERGDSVSHTDDGRRYMCDKDGKFIQWVD